MTIDFMIYIYIFFFTYALHTLQWKRLQIAITLCRNFKNIAFIWQTTVMEAQLLSFWLHGAIGSLIAAHATCMSIYTRICGMSFPPCRLLRTHRRAPALEAALRRLWTSLSAFLAVEKTRFPGPKWLGSFRDDAVRRRFFVFFPPPSECQEKLRCAGQKWKGGQTKRDIPLLSAADVWLLLAELVEASCEDKKGEI